MFHWVQEGVTILQANHKFMRSASDLHNHHRGGKHSEAAVIVFEDEASFRQMPTLHVTWAKRGSQPQIPTRGERNTQKIIGAVRLDNASFIYLHQQDYFQ